ncbi:MAG TPA: DUF4129 domain-containing protein [Natronosporangium sp.]
MRRGWLSGLVVAMLLAGAAVAARFATLDLRTVDREPIELATRPPVRLDAPPAQGDAGGPAPLDPVSPLLTVPILLILLAAAGWVGWALLRRRRRRGAAAGRYRLRALTPARTTAPGWVDGGRLLAAVDQAVAQSEDDPDPRRAVIACWVRLAEAAAAAGIPRFDSDTATDLVVRMLRDHRVSEPVLGAFADAYWLARYTTHPVDEQLRTQAQSALRRLRGELAARHRIGAR